jgi:2,3-dihydroxybenzoate-AMP ligase
MAEGPLSFTRLDEPEESAFCTQGRPLCPDDEFRVVDDLDRDLPGSKIGHLIVRGPTTPRGYYRAEAFNAQIFTHDGFLRTGDLARFTPEGSLVIEGRVKDVINRGGEKISSEELEGHLLQHPAVRTVSVIGYPDEVMGEKTCVVVVPYGEAPTLEELRHFLTASGLADYKLPDRLEVASGLPYTNVGKVDKKALRSLIGVEKHAQPTPKQL